MTDHDLFYQNQDKPTKSWDCGKCGRLIERYRGMGDIQCECGAWYNSFGQRLADDWMKNRSNWDEDVSDLDGYEEAALVADREWEG